MSSVTGIRTDDNESEFRTEMRNFIKNAKWEGYNVTSDGSLQAERFFNATDLNLKSNAITATHFLRLNCSKIQQLDKNDTACVRMVIDLAIQAGLTRPIANAPDKDPNSAFIKFIVETVRDYGNSSLRRHILTLREYCDQSKAALRAHEENTIEESPSTLLPETNPTHGLQEKAMEVALSLIPKHILNVQPYVQDREENYQYGASNGVNVITLGDITGLWNNVDSSRLNIYNIPIANSQQNLLRKDFIAHACREGAIPSRPPVIGFTGLNEIFLEYLLRNKATSAIGIKSKGNGRQSRQQANLTNGEAHSAIVGVIPLIRTRMSGDVYYNVNNQSFAVSQHTLDGKPATREVILGARSQLDFETPDVSLFMLSADIKDAILGTDYSQLDLLPRDKRANPQAFAEYESKLKEYEIFKYTAAKRIPSIHEALADKKLFLLREINQALKDAIENNHPLDLSGVLIRVAYSKNPTGAHAAYCAETAFLSAEMMFRSIQAGDRSEFAMLNAACLNGFAYCRQPPSIFLDIFKTDVTQSPASTEFAVFLEYLFALSAKQLINDEPWLFSNMKEYAYNDFYKTDINMLNTFKRAFSGLTTENFKVVAWKDKLSSDNKLIVPKNGIAQYIPTNDDPHGENQINEGVKSQHGAIAVFSDYAAVCNRFLEQLTQCVIEFDTKFPTNDHYQSPFEDLPDVSFERYNKLKNENQYNDLLDLTKFCAKNVNSEGRKIFHDFLIFSLKTLKDESHDLYDIKIKLKNWCKEVYKNWVTTDWMSVSHLNIDKIERKLTSRTDLIELSRKLDIIQLCQKLPIVDQNLRNEILFTAGRLASKHMLVNKERIRKYTEMNAKDKILMFNDFIAPGDFANTPVANAVIQLYTKFLKGKLTILDLYKKIDEVHSLNQHMSKAVKKLAGLFLVETTGIGNPVKPPLQVEDSLQAMELPPQAIEHPPHPIQFFPQDN